MDKSKIIDYVISEWAMRSHDGLASGYGTKENIDVLKEILAESDASCEEIDEVFSVIEGRPPSKVNPKFFKRLGGKDVAKKDHPYYPEGTSMEDIVSGKATPRPEDVTRKMLGLKPKNATKPSTGGGLRSDKNFTEEENKKFEDYGSPQGKGVRKDDVEHVRDSIRIFDKNREFMSLYNTLDLSNAIEQYGNTNLAPVINAIDKRERKGLGRGELAFIFMLKDYKSGGTADVDLLYAEAGGDIEMKELTGKSKKKIVKVSAATLNGFYGSEFKVAVDELAMALNKNKGLGPFLERVLSGTKENSAEPLYPTSEPVNITKVQTEALSNFIKYKRTTEMPAGLFNALAIIGNKLAASDAKRPKDRIPPARADIVIGKDKQEYRIENPADAKRDMDKLSSSLDKKADINLTVSLGATKTDAEIEQLAENLDFFKKQYTIESISEELSGLISEKYSGILLIDKRGGNKAEFIPKGTYFKFLGLTLNGIKFEALPQTKGIKGSEETEADKED